MDFEFTELTDEELDATLGIVPEYIKQQVEDVITEKLTFLQRHYYPQLTLKRPVVKYDLQGHHAGWANGDHTIRLNSHLLNTHTEDMLKRTLPHEIAHIVQHQVYPHSRAHGREWARIMAYMGLPADRCHQYETVAVRKKSRPYRYYCDCRIHDVTVTLHRRIQHGNIYTCRRCKGELRKEQ